MAAFLARLKGNKNMTIILALAAVAIWSTVALRIAEPSRSPKIHTRKSEQVSNENFKDSILFMLSLNYEDPFHLSVTPKSVSSRRPKTSAKTVTRRVIETSDIFYLGSVIKASGERKALVRHRSKYYYADVNDTIGTFLVKQVYPDSIMLVSGNQYFWAIRHKDI